MISNKSKGSKFEEDVAKKLSEEGWWCTLLAGANHTNAQPADIVAAKNNIINLIDCKTLENKNGIFNKNRIEENQRMCYKRFLECGNLSYFIFILWNNDVYCLNIEDILKYEKSVKVYEFDDPIWRNFYED